MKKLLPCLLIWFLFAHLAEAGLIVPREHRALLEIAENYLAEIDSTSNHDFIGEATLYLDAGEVFISVWDNQYDGFRGFHLAGATGDYQGLGLPFSRITDDSITEGVLGDDFIPNGVYSLGKVFNGSFEVAEFGHLGSTKPEQFKIVLDGVYAVPEPSGLVALVWLGFVALRRSRSQSQGAIS